MDRLVGYFGEHDAQHVFDSILQRSETEERIVNTVNAGAIPGIPDISGMTGDITFFEMDNSGTIGYRDPPVDICLACNHLMQCLDSLPARPTSIPPCACREGYSMAIACNRPSIRMVVMRRGGPALIVGFRNDGYIIATDFADILYNTSHYRVIEDNEMALMTSQGVCFVTLDGRPLRSVMHTLRENSLCARLLGIGCPTTVRAACTVSSGSASPGSPLDDELQRRRFV